jgi:hypothetical protein
MSHPSTGLTDKLVATESGEKIRIGVTDEIKLCGSIDGATFGSRDTVNRTLPRRMAW